MPRPVTDREAVLMREFGFKWVVGAQVGFLAYSDLRTVNPLPTGFRAYLRERAAPLSVIEGVVRAIDLPAGTLASGRPKNLETAHIFAYCESLRLLRDGTWETVYPETPG